MVMCCFLVSFVILTIFGEIWHEKFEYTNVVIRSHELKKDRQNNGQKKEDNRQWYIKQYMENGGLNNTNSYKNQGWTRVVWKGKKFLFY
jgi:hypothetical protein